MADEVIVKELGAVTAYAAAVKGGYTGTYAEFCRDQAEFAENAKRAAQAAEDAERHKIEAEKIVTDGKTVLRQETTTQIERMKAAGDEQVIRVGEAGAQAVQEVETARADMDKLTIYDGGRRYVGTLHIIDGKPVFRYEIKEEKAN